MLETSQDILYIAVALCVLIFTGFLVWIMYYLAQIMRQSNEIITDVRKEIVELQAAIQNIKEKVASSATSISFLTKQIKDVVDFVRERKQKKISRRK